MKTKTPKEDPSIKAARDREERRTDAAFVENAAANLDEETRRRIRRFGSRAAVARGAGRPAGTPSAGGGSNSSSGGGSFDPGAGGGIGGGSGGKSGGGNYQQEVI